MSNPLLLQNINNISDLEMNVLQVAIDHMVEHLEDLLSDSDFIDSDDQERLEAAQKLKRWFA